MFGKREIVGRQASAPRTEPSTERDAWLLRQLHRRSSLRDRVIREIDPSVAATVPPDVLRRQIEEIIHDIANEERLELSGREQARLAEELANDMTGYGPLQPLLLDERSATSW